MNFIADDSQAITTLAKRSLDEVQHVLKTEGQKMAAADPSDFEGLGALAAQKSRLQEEIEELELRWLELGEALE